MLALIATASLLSGGVQPSPWEHFWDEPRQVEFIRQTLRGLKNIDHALKRSVKEQAETGRDRSHEIRRYQLGLTQSVGEISHRLPHTPLGRFLRVGITP